jgi:hypothetical protein
MAKTFWYENGILQGSPCIITDIFALGYYEVYDLESKEYFIKHITKIKPMTPNEKAIQLLNFSDGDINQAKIRLNAIMIMIKRHAPQNLSWWEEVKKELDSLS